MSRRLHTRGRSTRTLLRLALERIFACEQCSESAEEYLHDILAHAKMTRPERHRVGEHIYCANCEAPIDPSYDLVAGYAPEQRKLLRRRRLWAKKYAHQLHRFHGFLIRFPSLGVSHPMGRRLAEAVRLAPTVAIDPKTWYRARTPTDGIRSRADFLPPDAKAIRVHVGRHNHVGQFAYYVADSNESAAIEKLSNVEGELWIAEVTVNIPLCVLDARTMRMLDDDPALPLVLAGLVYRGISVSRFQTI